MIAMTTNSSMSVKARCEVGRLMGYHCFRLFAWMVSGVGTKFLAAAVTPLRSDRGITVR